MKSNQITIKDIAKELKISPSTVSRALKDHPDISQETKKNVLELANRMDYQPNFIAWSLRKSKSNTIGVLIPNIVHHFFSTVISGIEDIAHDQGYHIIMMQTNESYHREMECIKAMMLNRVDGLLVSVSSETADYEHIKNLVRKNIPLVFFDRRSSEIEATSVEVDDYGGSFKAVEHLIETGCTHIIHLAGPEKLLISQRRKQGYLDALKKHHIYYDDSYVIESDNLKKSYATVTRLLKEGKIIDGIYTSNDNSAVGAMKAVKELGLHIPQDVSIIGFGDDPICQVIEPQLSSVCQSGYLMGQTATACLLQQMQILEEEEECYIPINKTLDTKLMIRESTSKTKLKKSLTVDA